MRVWEKNFLYTLALFTVLFFVSIFVVSTASFSSALNSERDAALREEYMLSLTLQSRLLEIESRESPSPKALPSLVASYSPSYQRKGIYISLMKDETSLFSSIPDGVSIMQPAGEIRVCETLSISNLKYLCIHDALRGAEESFGFVYLKDITAMYNDQKSQTVLLIITGAAVSVLFAFALYFTLRKIYRPINNLAHELRTPLTAIRGYAEYLRSAAADEEERYSASEYIIDESKRLSDICDRLLILANMREGEIAFEKVKIAELFENARMTFKCVEYETAQQYIRGDRALLQSMINNLVANAIKASKPEAIVSLKCFSSIIEVSDSGSGMSSETLSRVNKPNHSPDTRNTKNGGNGFGIPLSHQIAKLHGARLFFESEEGKGTIARITFTAS